MRNWTDRITDTAMRIPAAPALYVGTRVVSYAELENAIRSVAVYLRDQGVRPGSRIATLFTGDLTSLLGSLALARLGATSIEIRAGIPQVPAEQFTKACRAERLLVEDPKASIRGLEKVILDANAFIGAGTASMSDPRDATPMAPWTIMMGSGTTGAPKRFAISHDAEAEQIRARIAAWGLCEDDKLLVWNGYGFMSSKRSAFTVFAQGASVQLTGATTGERIDSVKRRGITILSASVLAMEKLLKIVPAADTALFPSLRILGVSGSTVSERLRRELLTRISPNIRVTYATNEFNAIAYLQYPSKKPVEGSVGPVCNGVTLEIVDEDDRPLPPGNVGLIRVKGRQMIEGYLDDPVATAQRFKNGWFYPMDLGRLEADGQLVFCGRADDMMIVNGINLYPAEIERCLAGHPAVRECIAFSIPHPVHQDWPVCAVVLEAGHDPSPETLVAFVHKSIGTYALAAVKVVDQIPRNAQGKPVRAELLALFGMPTHRSPTPTAGASCAIASAQKR